MLQTFKNVLLQKDKTTECVSLNAYQKIKTRAVVTEL